MARDPLFLRECKARSRRTSAVLNYSSVLDGYILPKFGTWEAGTVRKSDVRAWLGELLESGKSVELVNRVVRVFKTLLFHGVVDLEVIERNVLLSFEQYERTDASPGRRVIRAAFTEDEVQRLLGTARPHERALIALLCFTGMRPGEAYALRWQDIDLTAGSATITRAGQPLNPSNVRRHLDEAREARGRSGPRPILAASHVRQPRSRGR